MDEAKVREVFSDEEFVKSLLALETPEEVQKALAEKDIDLNTDEIKKIAEILQKKANGELTDEELENAAGGSIGTAIFVILVAVVVPGAAVTHYVTRGRW